MSIQSKKDKQDKQDDNYMGLPIFKKGDDITKYYVRLERYLLEDNLEKKEKILKFINTWYSYKSSNSYKFTKLWEFKNQYYKYMPNNQKSKEFMIKYFNEYNDYFNLDLEYNDELFTTYNVLYFIKLMLKSVKGVIKKELEEIQEDDDKIIKINKKYSIWVK